MQKNFSQSFLNKAPSYMVRVTENEETEGSKSSNTDLNLIYSSKDKWGSSQLLKYGGSKDGRNETDSRYKSVSQSSINL